MNIRSADGSAGDADYGVIGREYGRYRQPEPSIERLIGASLGQARRVLTVGAGAGSYEPTDRTVTAVEPSATMRAQRPLHRSVAVDAVAESLPFPDRHFDAAMATFTVHQWADLDTGLAEMRRVTDGPVLILSCDPDRVQDFWLNAYAADVLAAERRRYPPLDRMAKALGGRVDILPVPIPLDCRDGFNEAYFGRPERLLDPAARAACSAWSFVDRATCERYVGDLHAALESGAWDARHGALRTQATFDGSLRLLVAHR